MRQKGRPATEPLSTGAKPARAAGRPAYKRVLLKLSGEAFLGDRQFGIDPAMARQIAEEIAEVRSLGVEVALVIGGGNIFRGVSAAAKGLDRVAADHMGMLATIINALALQDSLESFNVHTRVLSALEVRQVAEPYIRRRAIRHLEKGRVVILAGGTGNPYFSTDSAAALRAMEIHAEAILKATKVDGIYTSDPKKDPQATKLRRLDYLEFLAREIKVMDSTAVTLCMDNKLPIVVFNLLEPGNIRRIIDGEEIGSIVEEKKS